MKSVLKVAVILVSLTALVSSLSAQPNRGRWMILGTANVDGGVDHDNIRVGQSRGYFRSLQIRVRGSAIQFQRVIAHYENGQDQELQLRDRIAAGGATRPLDLVGDRRYIRSVEFFYARASFGRQRPSVVLYGMR